MIKELKMIKEKIKRDKKINSKDKGDRFERIVCNKFKKAWRVIAYRTPGSGAYTSRQVSKAMKEAAMGDVVIEELPELVIECKNYYSLHMSAWFKEKPGEQSIFSFWNKLVDEARDFKKIPLLICKEAGSPIVVIVDKFVFDVIISYRGKFNTHISMNKDNLTLKVFELDEFLMIELEIIQLMIKDMGGINSKQTYVTKKRRLIL